MPTSTISPNTSKPATMSMGGILRTGLVCSEAETYCRKASFGSMNLCLLTQDFHAMFSLHSGHSYQ